MNGVKFMSTISIFHSNYSREESGAGLIYENIFLTSFPQPMLSSASFLNAASSLE